MSRMVGTVSRGLRAPIIRANDDLVAIVTDTVLEAALNRTGEMNPTILGDIPEEIKTKARKTGLRQ